MTDDTGTARPRNGVSIIYQLHKTYSSDAVDQLILDLDSSDTTTRCAAALESQHALMGPLSLESVRKLIPVLLSKLELELTTGKNADDETIVLSSKPSTEPIENIRELCAHALENAIHHLAEEGSSLRNFQSIETPHPNSTLTRGTKDQEAQQIIGTAIQGLTAESSTLSSTMVRTLQLSEKHDPHARVRHAAKKALVSRDVAFGSMRDDLTARVVDRGHMRDPCALLSSPPRGPDYTRHLQQALSSARQQLLQAKIAV